MLNGAQGGDQTGIAVSGLGDVNGDGLSDLLIGADLADPNGKYSGASYVVYGKSDSSFGSRLELSALDGSDGFVLNGAQERDQTGRAMSGLGDVNGDGLDDLLIGADLADPNGDRSGASYVVFGRSLHRVHYYEAVDTEVDWETARTTPRR